MLSRFLTIRRVHRRRCRRAFSLIARRFLAAAAFGQFALFWSGVLLTLAVAAAVPTVLCSLFLDGFIHACAESFSPAALLVIGPLILSAAVIGVVAHLPPGSFARLARRFYGFCAIPFDRWPGTGFFRIRYDRPTNPAIFGLVTGTFLIEATITPSASAVSQTLCSLAGALLGAATWRAMSGWQTQAETKRWFLQSGVVSILLLLLSFLTGNGFSPAPFAWSVLLLLLSCLPAH